MDFESYIKKLSTSGFSINDQVIGRQNWRYEIGTPNSRIAYRNKKCEAHELAQQLSNDIGIEIHVYDWNKNSNNEIVIFKPVKLTH